MINRRNYFDQTNKKKKKKKKKKEHIYKTIKKFQPLKMMIT